MDQLEGEILQYEAQLAQVKQAAADLSEGPEKNNLLALEADLVELIQLSKTTLNELVSENKQKDDLLDDEYSLFKAELAELESTTKKSPTQASESEKAKEIDLKDELEGLKGSKCQAPFMYKWTNDVTYHNAFVSHVPHSDEINGYDEIEVKVMFTNPTHKEMQPCPYYLEGDCKFTDDKCRFSHGESVLLSSLKEYREPTFSSLCTGCKVFAKQDDGLWYRASVVRVNENENNCDIKFESNSKEEQIPFHNILPLESNENNSGSSDDDNEDSNESNIGFNVDNKEEIVKRILSNPPGSALGEWEKFTKGFGSRIMAKMGYIHGAGLGKDGAGRVEPVPAVILPAGKSLDHCMMLKEKAGNDQDLFKAERKMKQIQRKHEMRLKKIAENEEKKTDIFTFINTKLDSQNKKELSKTQVKNQYKNESTRSLNVTGLQLAEEARKVEKEIQSLNQSLARHTPNSHAFNIIKEKLANKKSRLSDIQASERKIRREQDQRRDRQKLTVF